jgi:acetate kinase
VALGRLDALVFTAGIGEHAPRLRAAVCHGLGILGIDLDEEANLAQGGRERRISTASSSVAVLVVPTNEELEIARQAAAVVGSWLSAGTSTPAAPDRACERRG